tara:strand:- start:7842 stop:8675 length:834 start_codon:yes stop_codon:yes gene_type:complete
MKNMFFIKFITCTALICFSFSSSAEIKDACQTFGQQEGVSFLFNFFSKVKNSSNGTPKYVICENTICPDGTTSFRQPKSEGIKGSEGKCGQTAAANLFKAFCNIDAPPTLLDNFFWDPTPGVHPNTLELGMNNIWRADKIHRDRREEKSTCPIGVWKKRVAADANDFLGLINYGLRKKHRNSRGAFTQPKRNRFPKNSLSKPVDVSPLAVLIESDGKKDGLSLHWVTVVDMYYLNNDCRIIYNTWEEQYDTSCSDFSKKASKTTFGSLEPYTVVRLE